MGKPIAGRNKSPFGVNGINVDAAKLSDGTTLTNVKISKQRSVSMFDLISTDGQTVYSFVKLTGQDSSGVNLDITSTALELAADLAPGTFCISVENTSGVVAGFAIRLMLNKVTLQDGSTLYMNGYSSQGVVSVTSVTVTPATANILVGATSQLTAAISPTNATNKGVAWTTSNASIATVSSTGLVTAVANGSATITATTANGSFTDTTVVTVTTAVASVSLAPTTATLSLAGTTTQQLTPTVLPSTASNKNVTYVSGTPATATVSSTGLVTAVAVGTTIITVSTVDGSHTATSTITVTA